MMERETSGSSLLHDAPIGQRGEVLGHLGDGVDGDLAGEDLLQETLQAAAVTGRTGAAAVRLVGVHDVAFHG